jgi:hypothetical protein
LPDTSDEFAELGLRLDELAQFEFIEADSENPDPAESRSRNSFGRGTRWSNSRR